MRERPRFLFTSLRSYALHASRLPLMEVLGRHGVEVFAASTDDARMTALREAGIEGYAVPYARGGVQPAKDFAAVRALRHAIRKGRPDLVHCFQPKPLVLTALAGGIDASTCLVATITGLGALHARLAGKPHSFLYRRLLRTALARCERVIFQNPSDRDALLDLELLPEEKCRLIPGSGVDLARFAPPETAEEPASETAARVLMAGRLLWSKGVREYVEAARICRRRGPDVRFELAGETDEGHQDAVPADWLAAQRDVVDYVGYIEDMARAWRNVDLAVLPSYHEGLPRVLLEAGASGVPAVTADVPGCRDAICPGVTGLLVPPRDPAALADAILQLVEDRAWRRKMGAAARAYVEERFALPVIVKAHLDLYRELGFLPKEDTPPPGEI